MRPRYARLSWDEILIIAPDIEHGDGSALQKSVKDLEDILDRIRVSGEPVTIGWWHWNCYWYYQVYISFQKQVAFLEDGKTVGYYIPVHIEET